MKAYSKDVTVQYGQFGIKVLQTQELQIYMLDTAIMGLIMRKTVWVSDQVRLGAACSVTD